MLVSASVLCLWLNNNCIHISATHDILDEIIQHADKPPFHAVRPPAFRPQAAHCEYLPSDSRASKGTFLLWGMWPPLMPGRGSGAFAWKRAAPLASTTTSCCCSTLCSTCCRFRTCPVCTGHKCKVKCGRELTRGHTGIFFSGIAGGALTEGRHGPCRGCCQGPLH